MKPSAQKNVVPFNFECQLILDLMNE